MKWVLGGLALLTVVVVSVVTTLLVAREDSDSPEPPIASSPPSTSVDTSDIASANDRNPAEIILDDSTCQRWAPVSAAFGHASNSGWAQRDPTVPATSWNPEQRNQYEAVEVALRDAADRSVNLALATPHRVMRELYEQFIAYSRGYVSRIDTYTEPVDLFARVAVSASTALDGICGAITYGAAGARSPLVPVAAPSPTIAEIRDPDSAEVFLADANPVCPRWLTAVDRFTDDTESWRTIDPNIPATDFDDSQRATNAAVMPIMESFATQTQLLGRESDNPVWADLATLSAQYRRAYVSALPTYTVADDFLQVAAGSLAGAISGACRAIGA